MDIQEHILSLEAEDKPGILVRIVSLLARRGFNIHSLSVANTHKKNISRFTMVIYGDRKTMEQVRKQVQKLIHVLTTNELTVENAVIREFMILKLNYSQNNIAKIDNIIDFYNISILSNIDDLLIVEISGTNKKINKLIEEFGENLIVESLRTGKTGLKKGKQIT